MLRKELKEIKKTEPSPLFAKLQHNLMLWQKEYERGCKLKKLAKKNKQHKIADTVKKDALEGIVQETDKFKSDFLMEVVS